MAGGRLAGTQTIAQSDLLHTADLELTPQLSLRPGWLRSFPIGTRCGGLTGVPKAIRQAAFSIGGTWGCRGSFGRCQLRNIGIPAEPCGFFVLQFLSNAFRRLCFNDIVGKGR